MQDTFIGTFLDSKPSRYYEEKHPYIPQRKTILIKEKKSTVSFPIKDEENNTVLYFTSVFN